jgi:hypothetical protein
MSLKGAVSRSRTRRINADNRRTTRGPFRPLTGIAEIWRELDGLRGTREEIESRLDDIESRLDRLPPDGFRKGTEDLIARIRKDISGTVII